MIEGFSIGRREKTVWFNPKYGYWLRSPQRSDKPCKFKIPRKIFFLLLNKRCRLIEFFLSFFNYRTQDFLFDIIAYGEIGKSAESVWRGIVAEWLRRFFVHSTYSIVFQINAHGAAMHDKSWKMSCNASALDFPLFFTLENNLDLDLWASKIGPFFVCFATAMRRARLPHYFSIHISSNSLANSVYLREFWPQNGARTVWTLNLWNFSFFLSILSFLCKHANNFWVTGTIRKSGSWLRSLCYVHLHIYVRARTKRALCFLLWLAFLPFFFPYPTPFLYVRTFFLVSHHFC